MKKIFLLISAIALFSLSGCASVEMLKQTNDAPPAGSELAVLFFDHANYAVGEKATNVAVDIITNNRGEIAFTPSKSEEILRINKVVIPRRISPDFIMSISKLFPVKYIMVGEVTSWYKGHAAFPTAKSTLFGSSVSVYRISDGQLIWSASFDDVGGGGIFAENPEILAISTYKKIFKTWKGFITKY